jgi:hypothetical protein
MQVELPAGPVISDRNNRASEPRRGLPRALGRQMTSHSWNLVVKMAGGFLLIQPLAAAGIVALSASLGLRRLLVAIAFVPVALLGGHVGFGLLASRPWARSRLVLWAPLHVSFIPALYWVMSKPVVEGIFAATVVATLLYGLYKVAIVESEQPNQARSAQGHER